MRREIEDRGINEESGKRAKTKIIAVFAALIPCQGVLCPKVGVVYPRLPSHILSYKRSTLKSHDSVLPMSIKVPGRSNTHLSLAGHAVKCASNYQSSVNDGEEPFLINATKQAIWKDKVRNEIIREVRVTSVEYKIREMRLRWSGHVMIRAAKSILRFLVEQPSQLKYIEWPGFQSTLKTATLALVLVGLFIIALSSVDSALSYMLALFLRRTS
ncbi:putative lecithin-cholesterol acyltransferase-like 1-like [Capsicum annuum]|nr:putative lecithin-cholesterol acyltransferase-like 1-like [Capsicum annuum]